MKNKIREKRRLNFSGKIFTPEIVRQLASVFENESQSINNQNSEMLSTLYSIDATDNSSFESQDTAIFEKEGLIEQKVMSRINMRLQTFDNSKNVELQISSSQAADPINNFVLVSGDDSTWVNGTIARFSEILNRTKIQNTRHQQIAIGVLLTILAFNILYFRLFYHLIEKVSSELLRVWVLTLGVSVGSMILFNLTGEYLKTLWPSVELQTGASHLQISLQKRNKIKWLLSSIALPLVLGLVYDLLKNVFKV
jgi:hypothetical protein